MDGATKRRQDGNNFLLINMILDKGKVAGRRVAGMSEGPSGGTEVKMIDGSHVKMLLKERLLGYQWRRLLQI